MGSKPSFNIQGHRYGRWTVIKPIPRTSDNPTKFGWLCRCDCGQEAILRSYALRHKLSTQCPKCRAKNTAIPTRPPKYDLTGLSVGHWEDIRVGSNKHGKGRNWDCTCIYCGHIQNNRGINLRTNRRLPKCKNCGAHDYNMSKVLSDS